MRNYRINKLDNGFVYVLYPSDINYIGVNLSIGLGSISEHKYGAAHLLEHLLLDGTKTKDYREITDSFNSNSVGNGDLYTDVDFIDINSLSDRHKVKNLIALLGDIVQNSTFPANKIIKEKRAITIEFEIDSKDESLEKFGFLLYLVYGEKVSKCFTFPTNKEINSIRKSDLIREYEMHFTPDNMALVLYGDVDDPDLDRYISSAFGGFSGKRKNIDLSEIKPKGSVNLDMNSGFKANELVNINFLIPTIADRIETEEERLPVDIAIYALEDEVFTELRENRGIIYNIDLNNNSYMRFGFLTIDTYSKFSSLRTVQDTVLDKVESLYNGEISKEKVEKLNQKANAQMLFDLYSDPADTAETMSRKTLMYRLLSKDKLLPSDFIKMYDVSLDEVRAVFNKYFNPKNISSIY